MVLPYFSLIEALRSVGYELRNTIIWDRTNIVNNIGIFGWPSNYITMGTTFEYLLDFWRPPVAIHQTQAGEITVGDTESTLEKTTEQSYTTQLPKTQPTNGKFPQELEDLLNQYL